MDRIAAIRDPYELLREATVRMAAAQEEVTELARLRRRVIQDLHDSGMSYARIAQEVGLTRGRIHQIRHAGPAPEGAFLGSGRVVIATPLKKEAIRSRPVVAIEDVAAAQRLGELARSLGLEPSFEHVPADGAVDLNRPNLVVICGPRISEPVARVLAQDPILQFERASDGTWTLVDRTTGTVHRSGQDQDPPVASDVAYLGRLPRPDGHGSLIVLTGIHPPGSLGVVHLICTQITELFAQVNTANFSVLVGTEYEPGTNEPHEVTLLTPFYRLEEA
ncbi:sigma-70 family RNA polymerase sigma factor [Micromonospora cathayae]|uniref:Sigma-70 family RNA polymerase sigma factor n=1 Tax=Micromonospora cathayae TaxID=3028804 RepID=A0ABY7ZUB3_9ACTN|nr:sigma-70 family RNA polymerase sigma factor [Micromonospora sp. HUAS 3]WDZ85389.1 sigma-70 family RNA polymerase sigma factor [Micromonospora sp. HUAS 3]